MITKLTLKNYRQYAFAEFNFPKGVVGIVGGNGEGKSHLFEAMCFAFTGTTASDDNKEDLLNWGAEDKTGWVELEFNKHGKHGVLKRDICKPKASLDYDGEKLKSVTAVNKFVKDVLGIDKDLCQKALFVPQDDLAQILFDTPAERIKAWQRLCGMYHTERIYEYMGKVISGLPEVADYAVEQNHTYERLKSVRKELVTSVKAGRHLRAACGDRSLQELIGRRDAVLRLKQIMTDGDSKLKQQQELESQLNAVKNEIPTLEAKLKDLPDPQKCQDTIAAVTNMLAQLTASEAAIKRRTELEQQLAEAKRRHEEVLAGKQAAQQKVAENDKLLAQIDALADEIQKVQSSIQVGEMMEQALNLLNVQETAVCPFCHSKIENPEQIKQQVQASLGEARTKAEQLRAAYNKGSDTIKSNTQEANAVEQAITSAEQQLEYLTKSLETETLPEIPQFRKEDLELAGQEAQKALSEIQTVNQRLDNCNVTKTMLESQVDAVNKELDTLVTTAKDVTQKHGITIDDIDSELEKVGSEIKIANQLTDVIAEYKSLKATAKKELDILRKINAYKVTQQKEAEIRETLEKTRHWFHRSQGPRAVVIEVLKRIVGTVNSFLEEFSAPFSVIPDEEHVLFRVVYHDGRTTPEEAPPVTVLSGGEKVILAVSFRFAAYYVFAGQLGLMALDEPTRYLDATNREMFCSVVEKVKSLSEDLNLQIMISTHFKPVLKALDTVFTINNLKKEQ